jgi:hypothetical protein
MLIVRAREWGYDATTHFVWFHDDSKPISNRIIFELHRGDMYFVSKKATGFDRKRGISLRTCSWLRKVPQVAKK